MLRQDGRYEMVLSRLLCSDRDEIRFSFPRPDPPIPICVFRRSSAFLRAPNTRSGLVGVCVPRRRMWRGQLGPDNENLQLGCRSLAGFLRPRPGSSSWTSRELDCHCGPKSNFSRHLDRPDSAGQAKSRPGFLDASFEQRRSYFGRNMVSAEGQRGVARHLDGSHSARPVILRHLES